MVIKFVPGFVAAIAAFWAFRLVAWVEGFWFKFLTFLVVYLVVAVALDIAMTRYGKKPAEK